jgi:hypothetical protein
MDQSGPSVQKLAFQSTMLGNAPILEPANMDLRNSLLNILKYIKVKN